MQVVVVDNAVVVQWPVGKSDNNDDGEYAGLVWFCEVFVGVVEWGIDNAAMNDFVKQNKVYPADKCLQCQQVPA